VNGKDPVKEQGWYVDPYRLHEARWFSEGTPTALVRDEGVTSQDPPPNTPYLVQPEAIQQADDNGSSDGSDESRDDAVIDAVWTIFTEAPPD